MSNRSVELTEEQLSALAIQLEDNRDQTYQAQQACNEHVTPMVNHFINVVMVGFQNNPAILTDGYKYKKNESFSLGPGDVSFNVAINYKNRPRQAVFTYKKPN